MPASITFPANTFGAPNASAVQVPIDGLDLSPLHTTAAADAHHTALMGKFADLAKTADFTDFAKKADFDTLADKVAGKIDHESQGYFEQEIAPYLNHPLVEYLGELGFDEKVELLSHAKCNLHPTSFREPFGLTVVEAAYCGTPTLAIARGSMPELIEFGRTGIWVEDFVEGYHRLEECFAMDRRYIASRARQLFTYRTMTKRYLQAYHTVIAEMKASASIPVQQKTTDWVRNRTSGLLRPADQPMPLLRMRWPGSNRRQSAQ